MLPPPPPPTAVDGLDGGADGGPLDGAGSLGIAAVGGIVGDTFRAGVPLPDGGWD